MKAVRVTDFMPPKSDESRIVRIVEDLEGRVGKKGWA
jgi:hypothetical protein